MTIEANNQNAYDRKELLNMLGLAATIRRSHYALGNEWVVDKVEVERMITKALLEVPSAFNSQSARVVLLAGEDHLKLWEITKEALGSNLGKSTEEKINSSFRSGAGTILFFEDMSVVKGLQDQFPLYADNFPIWSYQSSGMLQYLVWIMLESQGFGASLQHYNPLIDKAVAAQWGLPNDWKLIAQMPFGSIVAQPGEKAQTPIEERFRSIGK